MAFLSKHHIQENLIFRSNWLVRICDGDPVDRTGLIMLPSHDGNDNGLKIGEHSIDLTLACILKKVRANPEIGYIDPYNPDSIRIERINIFEDGIILQPGECYLGCVEQAFDTMASIFVDGQDRYYTQVYDGRSTVGRLFITSHQTAGYCDFGFHGYTTLEIKNVNEEAVKLYSGMRIGQMTFAEVSREEHERTYRERGTYPQPICEPQEPKLGRSCF
jgi:dCTP deaminase